MIFLFFFFNDTATTEIYTLSLHDALPICIASHLLQAAIQGGDPHRLAHLGALDVSLGSAASLLREAAACIDARPSDPCLLAVSRARLAVEAAAEDVLRRVPRAIEIGRAHV